MRPREYLHRLRQFAVAGDRSVVVPVGADQIRQDLRVAGIGFRARRRVAGSVAAHRARVEGVDLESGGNQSLYEQASVRLNADDDGVTLIGMLRNQLMDAPQPFDSVRNARFRETTTCLVEQAHVVMPLCPVAAQIDQRAPLQLTDPTSQRSLAAP